MWKNSPAEACSSERKRAAHTSGARRSRWRFPRSVYDGLSRPGVRIVSFAPILKHAVFPLAAMLDQLMRIGEDALGRPVEIEFAVQLPRRPEETANFGFLQIRPLVLSREGEELRIENVDPAGLVCHSSKVLGNGRIEDLRDVVVVDSDLFERSRSQEATQGITYFNGKLGENSTPYLLIGVGRWGSNDPWLGIPVTWDQISGARVIVEAGLRDLRVTPSQGSHFFQNLTAFQVGYFTVNPDAGEGFLDWQWRPLLVNKLTQGVELRCGDAEKENPSAPSTDNFGKEKSYLLLHRIGAPGDCRGSSYRGCEYELLYRFGCLGTSPQDQSQIEVSFTSKPVDLPH